MIKALIFDFDGTLFETKTANAQAYVEAFGAVGIDITENDYLEHFGLRFDELCFKISPTISHEDKLKVKDIKKKLYSQKNHLIKPNKNLIDFLKFVHKDYKTALVTTASGNNILPILKENKLDTVFDIKIFGEDVEKGKPDPQCYNICISKLGVEPEQCLVFEDSDIGIAAARSVGLHVIKVTI